MASKDPEVTPPKSALVTKVQQASLLDSPSRRTRSQSRRLSTVSTSSANSEAPSSPATRRSTRSRQSAPGVVSEDSDAVSILGEPGGGITRRFTRSSSQQPRSPPKAEVPRTRRNSLSSAAPPVRSTRNRPVLSPIPTEETSPVKSSPKKLLGVSPEKSPKEGGFQVSPRRLFTDEKSPEEGSPSKKVESGKVTPEDACVYPPETKRLSLRVTRSPRLVLKNLESKLDMVAAKNREIQAAVPSDKAATPISDKTGDGGTVDPPNTPRSVENTSQKTPESGALKSATSESQPKTSVSELKQAESPRKTPRGQFDDVATPMSDKAATPQTRSQTPQEQAKKLSTPQTPVSESGKKTATPQIAQSDRKGTPQIQEVRTRQTRSQTPVSESGKKSAPQTPQEKDGASSSRNQSPLSESGSKASIPQTRSQTPQSDTKGKAVTPHRLNQTPTDRRTQSSASESENLNKSKSNAGSPCPNSCQSQSRTQSESDVAKSDSVFKTPVRTPAADDEEHRSPRLTRSPARTTHSPRLATRLSLRNSQSAVEKGVRDMEEGTDVPSGEEEAEIEIKDVEADGDGEDSNEGKLDEMEKEEESLESSNRSAEGEKLSVEEAKDEGKNAEETTDSDVESKESIKADSEKKDEPEKPETVNEKDESEEDGREISIIVEESDDGNDAELRGALEMPVRVAEEETKEWIEVVEQKKIAVTEETDEDSDGQATIAEVQEIEEEDEDAAGLETEDEVEGKRKKSSVMVLEVDENDEESDEEEGSDVEDKDEGEVTTVEEFFDLEAEEDNRLEADEESGDDDEDESESAEGPAEDVRDLISFEAKDDCLEDDDDDDEGEEEDDDDEMYGFLADDEEAEDEGAEDEDEEAEGEEDDDDVDNTEITEMEVSKQAKSPKSPMNHTTSQQKTPDSSRRPSLVLKPTETANTPTPKLLKPFNVDNKSKSEERQPKRDDPSRRKSDGGRFSALPSSSTATPVALKSVKNPSRVTLSLAQELPNSESDSTDLSNKDNDSPLRKPQAIPEIQVTSLNGTSVSTSKSPRQASVPSVKVTSTVAENKGVREITKSRKQRLPENPHESDYDFGLLNDVPVVPRTSRIRFQVRDKSCALEKRQESPKRKLKFVVSELWSSLASQKVLKPADKSGVWNVKPIKHAVQPGIDGEKTSKEKKKKKLLVDEVDELALEKKQKKKKSRELGQLPLSVDDLRHKLDKAEKTSKKKKPLVDEVHELALEKSKKKKTNESVQLPIDFNDLRHKLVCGSKFAPVEKTDKESKQDKHTTNKTTSVESSIASGSKDTSKKSKKHKKPKSVVEEDEVCRKHIVSVKPSEGHVHTEAVKSKKKKNNNNKVAETVGESSPVAVPEKTKKKKHPETAVAESSTSDKGALKRKEISEASELVDLGTKKKKKKKKARTEEKGAEDNLFKSDDVVLDKKQKKKKALQERLQKALQVHTKDLAPLWGSSQSDDDEAPTAVSFSASRQSVLEEESKKKAFLEEKEKRMREKKNLKLHQIMEQKAERVKRKADFAQEDYDVEDYFEPSEVPVAPKGKKTYFNDEPRSSKSVDQAGPSKKKPRTEQNLSEDEKLERKLAEREQKRKEKGLAELLKRRKMAGSSFIPVNAPTGATRFGVVPLKNLNNDGNRLAAGPSDFRSQMLYGNRVNRVPNNVYQSQKDKKEVANALSSNKHKRWE